MPKLAALYCRSSKDRSAVSIQTQRHELQSLAASRDLVVTAEYADAVESGKDTDRPGFQALLRDLKARDRAWSTVLAYDTSRIGRRRYIAEAFRHECKKMGVEILFAKVPEVDPISQVILDSVLQAMDEVHSLMSREKGLAGMAENVRQGFRAGGAAPYGYRLEAVATGQVRDGAPVTKSRLEVDPLKGSRIAAWLQGRAAGGHAGELARRHGVELSASSLSHLEWSALTYAGHTVWNVHRSREDRGGQSRRRPRNEWTIQRGTHEALISDDVAEAILARLERAQGARGPRARISDYVLAGLLKTPAGEAWHGNAGKYRAPGAGITAAPLEEAVLATVAADMRGDVMVGAMLAAARAAQTAAGNPSEAQGLQAELDDAQRRMARLTALLEQTSQPGPLLRRIEELEGSCAAGRERLAAMVEEGRRAKALAELKESDVRRLLNALADDMAQLERAELKQFLKTVVQEVQLDPLSRAGIIHYRLENAGVRVASPGGFEPPYSP